MLISWPRQGIFCELAAQELGRPNFGLEHALSLLDTYAALQSFNLAFKRWTDMSPSVYREVNRAMNARPASHETADGSD